MMKNVALILLVLAGCLSFLFFGYSCMMFGASVVPVVIALAAMIGGLAGLGAFGEDV